MSSHRPPSRLTTLAALLLGCLLLPAGGRAETPGGVPDLPAPVVEPIARAQFTTAISDREPVDSVTAVPGDRERIFFFTELQALEGRTITHRWEHDGEILAEVPFVVGGPRWRVFSSKALMPGWTGTWTVKVVDEGGEVLESATFTLTETGSTDTQAEGEAEVETSELAPSPSELAPTSPAAPDLE